jgi:hypothetical protein
LLTHQKQLPANAHLYIKNNILTKEGTQKPSKKYALPGCFPDKKHKHLVQDVYIFLTQSENKTNTN